MVSATFRRINTDDLQVMDLQYARPDKTSVMTDVAAIKNLVDRDVDLQVLCASIARVLTFGLQRKKKQDKNADHRVTGEELCASGMCSRQWSSNLHFSMHTHRGIAAGSAFSDGANRQDLFHEAPLKWAVL
jgi:hypothetical protein